MCIQMNVYIAIPKFIVIHVYTDMHTHTHILLRNDSSQPTRRTKKKHFLEDLRRPFDSLAQRLTGKGLPEHPGMTGTSRLQF